MKKLGLILIALSMLPGCTLFQKQPEDLDIVPAYKIYDEFLNNAFAAEKTYANKKVAISGWVYEAGQDMVGQLYALLESSPDPTAEIPNPERVVCAQCMFKLTPENAQVVASLRKGDFIVAYGNFYGVQNYIIVTNCIIGK